MTVSDLRQPEKKYYRQTLEETKGKLTQTNNNTNIRRKKINPSVAKEALKQEALEAFKKNYNILWWVSLRMMPMVMVAMTAAAMSAVAIVTTTKTAEKYTLNHQSVLYCLYLTRETMCARAYKM